MEEIIEIKKTASKLSTKDWDDYCNEKLHQFNGVAHLRLAYNSGKNVLFTGPGGYGKSVGAEMFAVRLMELGYVQKRYDAYGKLSPFTMSFSSGMNVDVLLGGLDLKLFNETGKQQYLLENSFIEHEVVIFEELFDAYENVLMILKDILQSGYVRQGNQLVKIKTKMIIACTNKGYEEIMVDDSTQALLQRFHLIEEIKWATHTEKDYLAALTKQYPHYANDPLTKPYLSIVAYGTNMANVENQKRDKDAYFISPRTSSQMLELIIDNDCSFEALMASRSYKPVAQKIIQNAQAITASSTQIIRLGAVEKELAALQIKHQMGEKVLPQVLALRDKLTAIEKEGLMDAAITHAKSFSTLISDLIIKIKKSNA